VCVCVCVCVCVDLLWIAAGRYLMKTECFLRCLNINIHLFVFFCINKSFHFSTPQWTMLEFLWYWLGSTVIKSDSHLLMLTLPIIQITSLCSFPSTCARICHWNSPPLFKRIVHPEIKSIFIIYSTTPFQACIRFSYRGTLKEMLGRMSSVLHTIQVDDLYFKVF